LLSNIQQRSITPAAVQHLVADAPNAIVDITVGGRTYHHRAYALGIHDDPRYLDRQHLREFVDALTDLTATVGAAVLGPEHPFAPEHYLIQARPADHSELDTDVEPTIVPWPADAPVRLAEATACTVLPAAVAAPLFDRANALTYFTEDGGVTYQVAAVQQVPGRAC
jgi:hypothetical protein